MCGAIVTDYDETDRDKDCRPELIFRFAEKVLWNSISSKATGTVLRVACAALLLPTASTRQIGAAVGVSHERVRTAMAWIKENTPDIYTALWREK
jgi:hypothetical protein